MYIKIDENKRVIMQIADKFAENLEVDNVITFRVEKTLKTENGELLYYNPETNSFYTEKVEYTEEELAKAKAISEASAKKAKALKWLADNDWKVNKVFIGEWTYTDPRWLEYLEQRNKARAEIDAAEAILNQ